MNTRYKLLLLLIVLTPVLLGAGYFRGRILASRVDLVTVPAGNCLGDTTADGCLATLDAASFGGGAADCIATTVGELTACVSGASAGDLIYVAAGTYTLVSVLDMPDDITLEGAGPTQTIITGTYAGNLMDITGDAGLGPYNIANISQYSVAGVTSTAGDADNIEDGDLLYIYSSSWANAMVTLSTSAGVPGTGAFTFRDPTPRTYNSGPVIYVYAGFRENVTVRNIGFLAAGSINKAIWAQLGVNIRLENIQVTGADNDGSATTYLSYLVDSYLDVEYKDLTPATRPFYAYMGTNTVYDIRTYDVTTSGVTQLLAGQNYCDARLHLVGGGSSTNHPIEFLYGFSTHYDITGYDEISGTGYSFRDDWCLECMIYYTIRRGKQSHNSSGNVYTGT